MLLWFVFLVCIFHILIEGDDMFNKGDLVHYKKYTGKIIVVYENKTCDVELYHYRGFPRVIKQINNCELYEVNQIKMAAF